MANIFNAAALRNHVPAWQEAFPQRLADITHSLMCSPLVHSMMCQPALSKPKEILSGICLRHQSRLVQPGSNYPEKACDRGTTGCGCF